MRSGLASTQPGTWCIEGAPERLALLTGNVTIIMSLFLHLFMLQMTLLMRLSLSLVWGLLAARDRAASLHPAQWSATWL